MPLYGCRVKLQGHLAALQRKLAGLEKEKPRLLDLDERGIIPTEELEVDRRKLDCEIAATKEPIAGLGHSPEEAKEKDDLLRDLLGDVVELGEVLDAIRSGDIAMLAEALRASGSTVFVHIAKGRNAPIKVTGVELRVAAPAWAGSHGVTTEMVAALERGDEEAFLGLRRALIEADLRQILTDAEVRLEP